MKEKENDALAMPWENVAHLLSVCRMTAIKVGDEITEEPSLNDYDKVVYTQNVETIQAFSSHMVQVRVERAHTREHINVMIQALWTGDGSLPQGLTIQNTYMELRQGSKNAVMVVRNSTAYPQTLWKKALVARAVAATLTPGPPMEAQLQEGETSHRNLTPLNWLLGKDVESYLMNWT